MKEQFVPYEIALKLKEKGFDCTSLAVWVNFNEIELETGGIWYDELKSNNVIKAPLWQQVIDWFEDKFNLKFSIAYWNGYNNFLPKAMQYKYEVYIILENAPSITVRGDKGSSYFDTRKDAIVAAIIKALTLI